MAESLGSIYAEVRLKLSELQNDLAELSTKLATAEKEIDTTATDIAEKTKRSVSQAFKDLGESLENVGDKTKKAGDNIKGMGDFLSTYVTAPIVGLGALSFKAAMDFESAFAGVRKTVDATEAQFAALNKGIREMAKQMPASATEIANVAEAAGQLGIQTENILGFTKTMINLGVATNLTAEQAATALARFANITQMSQKDFDRLGSTIVALGNNLATTEAEIVEMAMRLAGAGHQVGLTEAQILSLAGALSSVGIEAEAGGSAFSKVMIEMANAVASGSEELQLFAKVAGTTAGNFKKAFQQDAAQAIIMFIEGLGRMSTEGQNVFPILEELGLSEIRVRDALLRAAGAGDLFRQSLKLGTQAWQENTALTKEAEQRYATTESQLQILKNRITDIAIEIRGPLLTAANNALEQLSPFIDAIARAAERFASLDPNIQAAIIAVAAFIAAVGPVLSIVGRLVGGIGEFISNVGGLIKILGDAGMALSGFTGPIALVLASLVALFVAWQTNFGGIRDVTMKVLSFVVEKFTELYQTIVGTLGPLIQYIVERWQAIQPILQPIFDWLSGYIGVTFQAIGQIVQTTISVILDIISGAFEMLAGIIQFFVALFTGDWQGLWESVKQILNGAVKIIKAVFADFTAGILSTIVNWIAGLIGKWSELFASLINIVVGKTATIRAKIMDLVNIIINAFKSLPSQMVSIGASIISGLISGLSSMVGSLMAKAKSIANSVVNTIRSALRIGSPSKVMIDFGVNVVKGLAMGIEKTKDLVEEAAGALADITVQQLAPTPALATPEGATAPANTVHQNAPLLYIGTLSVRNDDDITKIQDMMRQLYEESIKTTRARGRK